MTPTPTPTQLPDHLWSRAYQIGRAAIPLHGREDQIAAREALIKVLDAERPEYLPKALGKLIRSRQKDINGKTIPRPKQVLANQARRLMEEVEAWLEAQGVAAA